MDLVSRMIASLKTYVRGIALPKETPLFKVTPMVDEMESQSSSNATTDVHKLAAEKTQLDYLEYFHDA